MKSSPIISLLRVICAVGLVGAGVNHFWKPDFYVRIIPPGFPAPLALVAVSGFFEILGGVGLLIPRLRRPAGWGLIALLVSVFPANLYMALRPEKFADLGWSSWVFWARLPFQFLFGAAVWLVALKRFNPPPLINQK